MIDLLVNIVLIVVVVSVIIWIAQNIFGRR